MTTANIFDTAKANIELRNKKIIACEAAGALGGIALTALSPRSSKTSIALTAVYGAARTYIAHDRLRDALEEDTCMAARNSPYAEVTERDLITTGLGGLVDVTIVGYLSSFFLGK